MANDAMVKPHQLIASDRVHAVRAASHRMFHFQINGTLVRVAGFPSIDF